MRLRPPGARRAAVPLALALTAAAVGASVLTATTAGAGPARPTGLTISNANTPSGLKNGSIKHVWLIILENKSYDATFTGLNQNSYLWKTLPAQGVLLKDYYGTGHTSQDNYESLVSGQAPEEDTQKDCDVSAKDFGSNANIITQGGSTTKDVNYGQVASPAGPNAPDGTNGCVYPSNVPTLFNQLDASGQTWKGYNQDLRDQPGREDATCGGPGTAANNPTTNPTTTGTVDTTKYPGVVSFTGAQPNDQYVAKHSPFPWFHSLLDGTTTEPANGGTDCDANHVTNLDNTTTGLVHDLKSESTTPAFSWITPNNCSDAHDAVCKGNNLSGAFNTDGSPNYTGTKNDPENSTPKNYTGGLYASDLFLEYYIPLIERSAAFQDGGLIDITFDEANPPFTYSGNSFYDANQYAPTAADKPNYTTGLKSDAAGQNISGRDQHSEPTGPNSTLGTDAHGNQLYPGPGNNAFIDRPVACTSATGVTPPTPAGCVPGIVRGSSGTTPGPRTDAVTGSSSNSTILDSAIVSTDIGRAVTDSTDVTGPGTTDPLPPTAYVGQVTNVAKTALSNTDTATTSAFQLVDGNGTPITPTGKVTSITLAGETAATDPLYDATDPTPGGGDTGSVLISPYITPGTSTTTFYNHYSWLKTMEDLFQVSKGPNKGALVPGAGSISGGLDGSGHLGFAAQPGLTGFGPDVFTNPKGHPVKGGGSSGVPTQGLLILPVGAGAGYVVRRVRRRRRTAA